MAKQKYNVGSLLKRADQAFIIKEYHSKENEYTVYRTNDRKVYSGIAERTIDGYTITEPENIVKGKRKSLNIES